MSYEFLEEGMDEEKTLPFFSKSLSRKRDGWI
jgi:hypothetical protein